MAKKEKVHKFDIKLYFPDKDVLILKQLASEGILLYPMLISTDRDATHFAIGIMCGKKLKVGRICKKEFENDTCQHDSLGDDMNYGLIKNHFDSNNINLFKSDDSEDDLDLESYDASLIPTFITLYIRYIQQDGKI